LDVVKVLNGKMESIQNLQTKTPPAGADGVCKQVS
jgi:hypothetical protein